MIKRINYTRRAKIHRQDAKVFVTTRPGLAPTFRADINLARYRLPPDALVFVEAYRQSSFMRFPLGTVERIIRSTGLELTEFGEGDGVRFRVKVATGFTDGPKTILAVADHVPGLDSITTPDVRTPLLPVVARELGQEIWKVEFESQPTLVINRAIGDWKGFTRSQVFTSLVLPAAFRIAMERVLEEVDEAEMDDEGSACVRWIRFAKEVLKQPDPPERDSEDSQSLWIDECTSAFCRHHRSFDAIVNVWEREELQ